MSSFSSLLNNKTQTGAPESNRLMAVGVRQIYASRNELNAALPSPIARLRPDIVGDQLASKVCAVELQNREWVVLATGEYEKTDILQQALAEIFRAHSKKATFYLVASTLLLTLKERDPANGNAAAKSDASAYKAAFDEIVAWGIANNASDVHLNVNDRGAQSQVHFSIEGQYIAPERWRIPTDRLKEILNVVWQGSKGGNAAVFNDKTELQSRVEVTVNNTRVMGRWASLAADRGVSVTLRLLKIDQQTVTKSLSEQGYLRSQVERFERAQNSEGGAIVLSGVVGSGKSTTIASLISKLPSSRKIISLEDPVEYEMLNTLQNTISRALDDNEVDPFISKLRTIKRSAAHDILLGEIRDPITGGAFIDITGTGTSLYTTVHAKSAMQIPERLSSESIGVPTDWLASPGILNLLVYQALLPKLCPHCAMPLESLTFDGGNDARGKPRSADYWKGYIDRIQRIYRIDTGSMKVKSVKGCSVCAHDDIPQLNGYLGRDVVAEMIEPNTDREVLRRIKNRDTLGLQEHLERLPRAAFDDPDMTNKSMMECAIYKAHLGLFDPRDVETRTSSFETIEMIQSQHGFSNGR